MSKQGPNLCELVRTLIDSTCTYIASNVDREGDRFAYVRAMSRCLNLCTDASCQNDVNKMKKELLKLRKDASKSLRKRFELFGNTNRYYMLGIQHSLEVVESIGTRFDKGYSHADEFFVRSILGRMKRED